ISRHCDLSPTRLYPEDPNSAEVWKEGLGEMTLKIFVSFESITLYLDCYEPSSCLFFRLTRCVYDLEEFKFLSRLHSVIPGYRQVG
ncbi:hypothetical protein TNIN_109261, partial [Trichonephila inaurata madagascariensis]